MSDAPPATPPSRPLRNRARLALRVLLITAVIIPVVAGVSAWVATRSWFIVLMAAPALEQKLGGEIRIRDASYRGDGVLVFEDVVLRNRTHVGPAAQVLRIGRAEVAIDLGALFTDGVRIEDVVLDSVLLRMSEDARKPGAFNFAGLNPDWSSDGSDETRLPPTVRISSALIELGGHIGSEYRPVGQRRVAGEMYPATGGDGWFRFHLRELDDNGVSLGEDGIVVDGQWNVETLEHRARIEGLALDDQTFSMCPQMARLWWQRMQPQGPVGTAIVQWKQGEPFLAELQVDRMALTIPIAAKEFSASYRQGKVESVGSLPRMYVHSGTIRLQGNQLSLDNLIGEFGSSSARRDLVGMPYRVNLTIHDLPTFDWEDQQDWMEQVVTTAPFEMSVRMENFSLAQQPASVPPAVELPRQVADMLAKFNLSGWTLSTQVELTREAPEAGPDGRPVPSPIQTRGQAYISEASGAFEGFPYPLEDVNAYIQFDNERISIHYLTAKGSGDATLRISGTIEAPGKSAAVSFRLTARDLPLDDRFRRGLKGGQASTFDIMLHRPSFEMLMGDGLLPDQEAVEAAQHTRQELIAEFNTLPEADEERRGELSREIARLGTIVESGPFTLGGMIDMDLEIVRPPGPAQRPEITGTIEIERAGVVYGRFPYPVYVLGGALEVRKDRVLIKPEDGQEGIPIATPGGGRGRVTGEVRLVESEDGTRVQPDLEIDLRNDHLSDLLYTAMPLTKEEQAELEKAPPGSRAKRSLIARLLSGAGLSGWLNHTGTITADDEGHPRYDFAVELYDGKADPNDELFETMRELGLPSPRGVTLEEVDALIQITSDTIRLVDFVGHRGDARITADARMELDTDPIETEVTVEFDDLEMERYMVDLTPGDTTKTAALWDRYQPQGRYDAKLTYEARGKEAGGAELVLWPEELRIVIDEQPVWLICNRGEVKLYTDKVSLDNMVLEVKCDNREDGVIVLDGSYGLGGQSQDLELNGSWTEGQLASPLITEALRLIGAERQAERYRGYSPSGTFDAVFSYESRAGGRPPDYEFIVRPDTLGLRIDETPIFADLDPGTEMLFEPGRIILRDVAGKHAGGSFRVDGRIDLEGPVDADLELGYTGRIDSPQLLAILPRNLRSRLESMEIQGAEPVVLSESRLRITQIETEDEGAEKVWETWFNGLLETKGASIKIAGIEFTEVDGLFELRAGHDPETGPMLDIRASADRALARGRELTRAEAQVSLTDEGRVVSLPSIRADSYGGVLTGYAEIGLESGGPYEVALDVAGISFEKFSTGAEGGGSSKATGPNPSRPGDELFGSFRVSGQREAPESRRGRGSLRVVRGRMADMPVALRVLQLFELMPPLSGTMDFAAVDLYVDGERVVFEQLYLECPTLQLIGEGEMSFPGFELDVRFRTRGTLPLWADLVAGLSDQLFLVEVTGPIHDPQTKLVALPGLGQAEPKSSEPVATAEAEYAEDK